MPTGRAGQADPSAVAWPLSSRLMSNLLITNADVVTLDEARPRAQAVAILGGQIVRVGGNEDVLALRAIPGVDVIDAGGRTVVPGFVESHTHPFATGLAYATAIDCGTPPMHTVSDLLDALSDAAGGAERGAWIRGRAYDDSLIADMRHLTRVELDRAAPDHPVFITHVSGHLGYVNSAALAAAEIGLETPDPPGGMIARDGDGDANGLLLERALALIQRRLPRPEHDEMKDALAWAGRRLVMSGVTSIHDTGSGPHAASFRAYQEAAWEGRFPVRAYVAMSYGALATPEQLGGAAVRRVADAGMRTGFGDDRVKVGILKIVQDGSLQGHSGALVEPYHDAPDEHGMTLLPQPEFDDAVAEAVAQGIQVGTHGNGDAAIDSILDAYERALTRHPGIDHRLRIEHCQAVRDDQLDRMARLGVAASFFNLHVYYWGDRHHDRFLGPERGSRISPLRAAQQRGIRFGCHSDWWVTPVDPLFNVHVAVNRRTRGGRVLGGELAIDAETALRSMTIDGAYLAFEEDRKGTITPGKLGDVVVLSANPLTLPGDRIDEIEVDLTVIGGRVAYDRARDGGSRRDERLARDPDNAAAFRGAHASADGD